MKTKYRLGLLAAVLTVAGTVQAQEVYYSLDTSWAVAPSDVRITIQLDTTAPPPRNPRSSQVIRRLTTPGAPTVILTYATRCDCVPLTLVSA